MRLAGLSELRRQLTRLDQRLVDKVAATESPLLDRALPRLGAAADHGRLWLGIAAALALTGHGDSRRAAARGFASLTLAMATTNLLAKGLTGRVGPDADLVPPQRRLRRAPVTSSFPSGHSAAAAAFAAGVLMEMPVLAVPLGGLAAAVIASRVVTGVHYPSDVVGGAALGVAAAGVTLRLWPGHRLEPGAGGALVCSRRATGLRHVLAPSAGAVLGINTRAGIARTHARS